MKNKIFGAKTADKVTLCLVGYPIRTPFEN